MENSKLFFVVIAKALICLQLSAFPLTDSSPNSPEFRKQFMASYGVNAEIEPTLTQKDRPLYESIEPHLKSDPRYAIQQVENKLTSESSAAFDFLLGNLYYSIQDFNASKQNLQNAIKKFPSFRRAYRTLALIEVQQDNLSASIPLWLKVIALGGGDAQSYGLLGYAYLNEEKYKSALTAYEMARMFAPESHDYKRGEAQCLLMTQNYDGAIALFDELIAESPGKADYWLFQANAFLSKENHKNAIANLEIAHELGKPSWSSLVLLGDLYLSQNTFQLAIATYQKALNKHPSISVDKALIPLRSLLQMRHYEEAKAYLETFDQVFKEKLAPGQQVERSLMNARIDFGLGNEETARKRLQLILSTDPLNGHALILLGNHEKEKGNLAEAELHLERASHLPDFQAEAWESLGKLAIERRDFKQAVHFFQKAYANTKKQYLNEYVKRLASML